ncbi:MAG TPA: hypothetical protein VKZ56_04985, partial [Membranihabitans sp.]|nr:hypothetical protein [Membranihabitans sp.]
MQALDLDRIIGYAFEEMVRGRQRFEPVVQFREKGEVTKVSAGVAIVSGLPGVGYEELVEFPN